MNQMNCPTHNTELEFMSGTYGTGVRAPDGTEETVYDEWYYCSQGRHGFSPEDLDDDEVARHSAYGFVRPDADACYRCGRKEFTTPVEGFQVRSCDRCERLVCELCAEVDCGGEGEGVSWICDSLKGGCK